MALLERWHALQKELGSADVKLLAVSKYAPDEAVQTLIDAGQKCFGESRAQHLRDRARQWPECEWHMIGPVQKNKAKYIGRYASMWHSCDNLEMAEAVARFVREKAIAEGVTAEDSALPLLIQVNIADVPNQRGIQPEALPAFVAAVTQIEGLKVIGLMCMAPQGRDAAAAFRYLSDLRDGLLDGRLAGTDPLELCIGMSGDYQIAVAEGSTMVRLGSTLFGDWDVRNQES